MEPEIGSVRQSQAVAPLDLNRIEVQLNRQSAQLVRAPRDGRVQILDAAVGGALAPAGTDPAVVAPERVERSRATRDVLVPS